MTAKLDAWIERMEVCVEKLEANPQKLDSVVEHLEVPKEEATVETITALGRPIWGLVSSSRAPPTAEETDTERWWVLKEGGRHPQTEELFMLFLHRARDTVIRDQAGTMLQEEPRKDRHSGRDVRHNRNATTAYGTEA
jgi:hypothetical protein